MICLQSRLLAIIISWNIIMFQTTYNHTEGVGMFSVEGEYVVWIRQIILAGPVECWLCLVGNIVLFYFLFVKK